MYRVSILFLLLAVFFQSPLHAEPTGAQLLVACEAALKTDFSGIEGSMCDWYVTPCDCTASTGADRPRVCLPANVSRRSLAIEVITGLQDNPGLSSLHAADAVAAILSRLYPCLEPEFIP